MNKIIYSVILIIISIHFLSCIPAQQTIQDIKTPPNWPSVSKTEKDLKKYYDENKDYLDPIEGIWNYKESGSWRNVYFEMVGTLPSKMPYRIGIYKDSSKSNYEFVAIILESEADYWKPGLIKAYFRKTAYSNVYETLWYQGNFNEKKDTYTIDENGLITTESTVYDPNNEYVEYKYDGTFYKAYPQFNSNSYSNRNSNLQSTGSGFLISDDGLVITNYHVVQNSRDHIEVVIPSVQDKLTATVKLKDVYYDLAILQIENYKVSSNPGIVPFTIADESKIKVGEEVYTLGFPLGNMMGENSRFSSGRINSLYGIQDDPRLLQISNPIQPGDSGGPLFNSKGGS